jgi:hypothetical protein
MAWMARRLNLWDFDDTLAWSGEAVRRFMSEYPDVEKWKWWHDEEYSTMAALETLPVHEMWDLLLRTPGDHWILTGRNRRAVIEWLKIWKNHPDIGYAVAQIDEVISTSGQAAKHIDVALKKQREIERVLHVYDEIHVYDDRRMNLDSVSAVSDKVHPHLVEDGRVVTANVKRDGVFKDLQIIGSALTAIQGMEAVSDHDTYKELFRSTMGVIKRVQSDLIEKMSTSEILDYVTVQLAKSKITLSSDAAAVAAELDKGHQVEVEFRFEKKLKDFHGNAPKDVHRAVFSLGLNIETAFDKLQSPIICKVGDRVYGENSRYPVGFKAMLWRMK